MTFQEKVREVTSHELEDILRINQKPIILNFFSECYMPCLMSLPLMDSLAEDNPKINFLKINIEESKEIMHRFNVSNIPCIIFFKQGQEVTRIKGDIYEEKIRSAIDVYFI